MLFSGISFIYYFLPMFLLVYFITPKKGKNAVILLASLLFYGWGEPRFILLMLLSVFVQYVLAIRIEEDGAKRAQGWLVLALVFQLGLLGYFKYTSFFIGNINALFGTSFPLLKIGLPLGISFYTFQALSYTIDVYRGRTKAQRRLVDLATYIALFPQLIAGPIVRYIDVENALSERSHSLQRLWEGFHRFVMGLGKKVLLANVLGEVAAGYSGVVAPPLLHSWLYAIAFMLQIYFDFSGYSDMAIGLGKMLGFDFLENFRYPYSAKSISDFWRRWHISLSSWFRDYLYIPMGGNRVKKSRWLLNVFVVWLLTGFWHGAAWNFIAWGLFYFIFLVLEREVWGESLKKAPAVLSRLYVLFIVMVGFVLFDAPGLKEALVRIGSLFSFTGENFTSVESLYLLRSYGVVFLLGIWGASGLPAKWAHKLNERFPSLFESLDAIYIFTLLVLVSAYLVDSSFNPFLYFRF